MVGLGWDSEAGTGGERQSRLGVLWRVEAAQGRSGQSRLGEDGQSGDSRG